MKKIANILTLSKFEDNLLYNIVNRKDDLINGIPTLCVGIELTRKNYPDFNIINMKIDDNTFWTYGPREKRNIYENRLSEFNDFLIKKHLSTIEYKYVSVIVGGFNSNDYKILNEIIFCGKSASYVINDMAYVYYDNVVYGISLRDIKYCGGNEKDFLKKLFINTKIIKPNDISYSIKTMFNGCNYIIPSLF